MSAEEHPLVSLSSCVLCGFELRDRRVVGELAGTRFPLHPGCAEEGLEGRGLASPHGAGASDASDPRKREEEERGQEGRAVPSPSAATGSNGGGTVGASGAEEGEAEASGSSGGEGPKRSRMTRLDEFS